MLWRVDPPVPAPGAVSWCLLCDDGTVCGTVAPTNFSREFGAAPTTIASTFTAAGRAARTRTVYLGYDPATTANGAAGTVFTFNFQPNAQFKFSGAVARRVETMLVARFHQEQFRAAQSHEYMAAHDRFREHLEKKLLEFFDADKSEYLLFKRVAWPTARADIEERAAAVAAAPGGGAGVAPGGGAPPTDDDYQQALKQFLLAKKAYFIDPVRESHITEPDRALCLGLTPMYGTPPGGGNNTAGTDCIPRILQTTFHSRDPALQNGVLPQVHTANDLPDLLTLKRKRVCYYTLDAGGFGKSTVQTTGQASVDLRGNSVSTLLAKLAPDEMAGDTQHTVPAMYLDEDMRTYEIHFRQWVHRQTFKNYASRMQQILKRGRSSDDEYLLPGERNAAAARATTMATQSVPFRVRSMRPMVKMMAAMLVATVAPAAGAAAAAAPPYPVLLQTQFDNDE